MYFAELKLWLYDCLNSGVFWEILCFHRELYYALSNFKGKNEYNIKKQYGRKPKAYYYLDRQICDGRMKISMNKFELISTDEARVLAQQQGFIVVDLRSRKEFDNNHIDNAVNIEDADINQINRFNRKDLTWVLYCKRGSRSFRLASEMVDCGYRVMAVVGGFK